MLCSICLATFKRPQLLEKLLNSLMALKIPVETTIEIIIVDNDPEKTGEPIFKKFHDTDLIKLSYFVQPIKNISLTRNKSVKEARGEYILFIDDDEIASPRWLEILLKTIEGYKADGVFGRVLSYYEHEIPKWVKNCVIFNRPSPPTGSISNYMRTGNCIIKASTLKKYSGPFDPERGLTGGEDTHLFNKIKNDGGIFVNCFEASVSEFQPPSRTTLSYVYKKVFSTGNLFVRRKIEFSKRKKIFVIIIFLIKYIIYLLLSIILTIIALPNLHYRMYWSTKVFSNLGHLSGLLRLKIKSYK